MSCSLKRYWKLLILFLNTSFLLECTPTPSVSVSSVSIIASPNTSTMYVGDRIQLDTRILPDNATDKSITWKSSNSLVATVSTSGLVTACGAGSVNIVASASNGVSSTFSLNVLVAVSSVEIRLPQGEDSSLFIGESLSLEAIILPANATNNGVIWSSSNDAIASVSADGIVTAIDEGEANIVVTTIDGNISAHLPIVVLKIPVNEVLVFPSSYTMRRSVYLLLSVFVFPEDATNKSVIWSSSNQSVVTVDDSGMILSIGVGEAVVSATVDGVTATCSITVYDSDNDPFSEGGEGVWE